MLRITFGSFLVLSFCTVSLLQADEAKDKSDKDKNHKKATITKVDSSKSSITVTMKDKQGKESEKTLQLGEGAKYFDSDGKSSKIDAFQAGDHVCIAEKDGKISELKKCQARQAKITKVDDKKPEISSVFNFIPLSGDRSDTFVPLTLRLLRFMFCRGVISDTGVLPILKVVSGIPLSGDRS